MIPKEKNPEYLNSFLDYLWRNWYTFIYWRIFEKNNTWGYTCIYLSFGNR